MIKRIECRNSSRAYLGSISDAKSIIWQVEYIGTGNFEIVVPYTKERFDWLQPNNYITRPERTELGFIETLELNSTPEEGRTLKATGRFGCVLLERRLLYALSGYRGILLDFPEGSLIEEACQNIVTLTLINAPDSLRNVNWLFLAGLHGFTETTIEYEAEQANALEVAQSLLLADGVSSLGHKVVFDRQTLTAEYDIYKGQTRDLVFSQTYKNLLSFNWVKDLSIYKTRFLITGENYGDTFKFFTTKNLRTVPNAEQIREYLFESSLSRNYTDKNGHDHTRTDAQYSSALIKNVKTQFKETLYTTQISGTVDLSAYKYGTDYNVGDIITIKDVGTGLNAQSRIWSITEVQDDNGYAIEADFEGGAD